MHINYGSPVLFTVLTIPPIASIILGFWVSWVLCPHNPGLHSENKFRMEYLGGCLVPDTFQAKLLLMKVQTPEDKHLCTAGKY